MSLFTDDYGTPISPGDKILIENHSRYPFLNGEIAVVEFNNKWGRYEWHNEKPWPRNHNGDFKNVTFKKREP